MKITSKMIRDAEVVSPSRRLRAVNLYVHGAAAVTFQEPGASASGHLICLVALYYSFISDAAGSTHLRAAEGNKKEKIAENNPLTSAAAAEPGLQNKSPASGHQPPASVPAVWISIPSDASARLPSR